MRFPEITFEFPLRNNRTCHVLSIAFDNLRKLPSLQPLSKDLYISWVITSSWLTQESQSQNPD